MAHSAENFAAALTAGIAGASTVQDLGEREINCETHGVYTSVGKRYFGKREVWAGCPACKAADEAQQQQAEAVRAAAASSARIEALIEEAAIPRRFIGRSFDNFRAATDAQKSALNIARQYAADFDGNLRRGAGLVLSGMPGTGKSHLAAAVLQAIMPRHCGMYTTAMNVIRAVRGTWRKDSEKSESQILGILGSVPLLVLDEIGVQYGTDGEQTILFDVLDKRYRDMMPTILLTNEDKEGFKRFIGARSFDRLVETARWVPFEWESYRPTARKGGEA